MGNCKKRSNQIGEMYGLFINQANIKKWNLSADPVTHIKEIAVMVDYAAII